jgi:hypothetical protein
MGNLIQTAGGAAAVLLGLSFVFVITLVAMGTVAEDSRATVATAAFGALGTIVGAYSGVKLGAAGKEEAEAAREAESIKVQTLAARLEGDVAVAALNEADQRSEDFLVSRAKIKAM